MANAKISYVNAVDASTTVLSASSARPEFPVTNVATTIVNEEFWQPAAGDSTPSITVDFGAPTAINDLAVVISSYGAFGYTDTVTWAASNVSAGGSEIGTGSGAGCYAGYNLIYLSLGSISARYVTVTFNPASLGPAQYLRVGRLWIGPSIQTVNNFAYGYADRWEDATVVSTSPYSGSEYVDNRPRRRVVTAAFNIAKATDAENFKEIDRVVGLSNQLLFVPDPAGAYVNREAMICRLHQMTDRVRDTFSTYKKQFTFRQSL